MKNISMYIIICQQSNNVSKSFWTCPDLHYSLPTANYGTSLLFYDSWVFFHELWPRGCHQGPEETLGFQQGILLAIWRVNTMTTDFWENEIHVEMKCILEKKGVEVKFEFYWHALQKKVDVLAVWMNAIKAAWWMSYMDNVAAEDIFGTKRRKRQTGRG